MVYVEVCVNVPLFQTFFYKAEDGELLYHRCEINFAHRKTKALIIGVYKELPETFNYDITKIKAISHLEDKILSPSLVQLAKWISSYYITPLGQVLFNMIPGSKREASESTLGLLEEISPNAPYELSEEQEKAVNDISSYFHKDSYSYHYLYGKTGSGKTEVFLSLTDKVLKSNKSVIYLVPEIGLTGQVIKAFQKRFGDTVAVLHSGLSPSQKLKQWKRILNQEASIIIGARSAIFAPTENLGLIIIDEEHDGSYKSGQSPRYHARQVAMYRAMISKIPLVMGSATPSLESYYLMNQGKLHKHTLTKRLAGGKEPTIKFIDLSKYNMVSSISKDLEAEVNKTLLENRQVILFLNKRGFTHSFKCVSCGYELKCQYCSTPLVYHKGKNVFKCHYCGYQEAVPQYCPKCGSVDTRYKGFGTEYIEEEVGRLFPNARVLRLDTDSITNKKELEAKITAFKNQEYDILLGTQMIAKGLNFPHLKLVGIVNADSGLNLSDFRAGEKTFSLLTQVAGRAGRYFPDGKVLIQTYYPYREPIYYASLGKTEEFYKYELENREIQEFPPFSRLSRLVFRSVDEAKCQKLAEDASTILKSLIKEGEVLGPSECPILKLNGSYRYHILLRGKDIKPLQNAIRNLLQNYTHDSDVYIEIDIDPVSLM